MGLDLGEWLCDEEELKFEGEEDEGDGGETKSQMTSTRVRTPTSPLPLPPHCMESGAYPLCYNALLRLCCVVLCCMEVISLLCLL